MSNRIDRCFEQARAQQRKVLIPFITAGDPDPAQTVAVMHALVAGGADLLELGVPFSDPMADGPVIQAASERAVARGVNLAGILEWVAEFRKNDPHTPVVLMGYMNPVERFGYQTLVTQCAQAGVDGLLLVDCPPEELPELHEAMLAQGVYPIRLVAPTTNDERLQNIATTARGFVYYVSFKGITGAGHLDSAAIEAPVARIRQHTAVPVAVGFGIRDGASAAAVAQFADAVVIGSALVEQLAATADGAEVTSVAEAFVRDIRAALDRGADVKTQPSNAG